MISKLAELSVRICFLGARDLHAVGAGVGGHGVRGAAPGAVRGRAGREGHLSLPASFRARGVVNTYSEVEGTVDT